MSNRPTCTLSTKTPSLFGVFSHDPKYFQTHSMVLSVFTEVNKETGMFEYQSDFYSFIKSLKKRKKIREAFKDGRIIVSNIPKDLEYLLFPFYL